MRIRILIAILTLPFLGVLARLAALQLWQGEEAQEQIDRAESLRRRITLLPPTRGSIRDQGGAMLAQDSAAFDLEFTLQELHPRERYLPVVERALGLCEEGCRQSASPDGEASCRGRVLEEHIQRVLGGEDPEAAASEDADPVLVDRIPAALKNRLHQKLRGGLPAMERMTGLYFFPGAEEGTWELRARPRDLLSMERTLRRVSALAEVPHERLLARVAEAVAAVASARNVTERDMARNQRRLLLEKVSDRAINEVVYQPELFPGMQVMDGRRRVYPRGEAMAAVVGHLRGPGQRERDEGLIIDRYEMDIDFILDERFAILRRVGCEEAGGVIGTRGLEERYDARLRGAYGVRVEEVDARHVPRRTLYFRPPERGQDLPTSLHGELQESLYRELEKLCLPKGEALAACAAVIDLTGRGAPGGDGPPGALLAVCGFPGFDPHRMRSQAYLDELNNRQVELRQGILFNRPLQVHQPPGSIFKLVVAAAALESGVEWPSPGAAPRAVPLSPFTRYACTHRLDPQNPHSLRCLSRSGHQQPGGEVDLLQALQYSCNIYFYRLGRERLQPAALWAWAQELGFGRSPGVDLEAPDYDPGRRSLLRREVSREGMCQYAIGGPSCVTASVLQVLRCVAAIALASGEIPWPYLATPRAPERTALRPATARILQEGMRRVVHSPGGTAADDAQGLNLYRTAVKTGTADLREGDPEALDPERRPVHCAWMAGFAPLERPEIAFAILIERTSLHGGDCAQVAVPLLEYFASRDPGRYRSARAAEASSGGEAAPGEEAGGEDGR